MTTQQPLPCPFCGSKAVSQRLHDVMQYGCPNIKGLPICLGTRLAGTLEQWNRRAVSASRGAPSRAEVEALHYQFDAASAHADFVGTPEERRWYARGVNDLANAVLALYDAAAPTPPEGGTR